MIIAPSIALGENEKSIDVKMLDSTDGDYLMWSEQHQALVPQRLSVDFPEIDDDENDNIYSHCNAFRKRDEAKEYHFWQKRRYDEDHKQREYDLSLEKKYRLLTDEQFTKISEEIFARQAERPIFVSEEARLAQEGFLELYK